MELDLSDNAFGPDGVRGFEALLKSSACFTLHELKLNNCGMGIGGGKVGAATPSPTSLCPPPSSLPGPVLCLHPPGVCALGHPLSGMVRLLFFSSKDKGLKGKQPMASGERRWICEGGVAKQPSSVLCCLGNPQAVLQTCSNLLALQSTGFGHHQTSCALGTAARAT